MADRAADVSPAGPRVQAELTAWQRRVMIGNERRLGPSLQNAAHAEHVFKSEQDAFEFGTSVPYSRAHRRWRMENGRSDFLNPPASVLAAVGRIVARYIVRGDR
jgi:hypothetical protein